MITIAVNVGNARIARSAFADADITVEWRYFGNIERWCLFMFNNVTKASRRICPEDGGCWHDEGWQPWGGGNVLPSDGNALLPTYYDGNNNLYIVVGPGKGGVFSGSGIGTCLPFTSNATGAIMLPAQLVQ